MRQEASPPCMTVEPEGRIVETGLRGLTLGEKSDYKAARLTEVSLP